MKRPSEYVKINVQTRKTGKSNIKIVHDGVRFFMIIVRICTFYSPLKIFLPTSMGLFLVGLAYYVYTFLTYGRFTNMSALLFTTSILIFMLGLISEQISQMRFGKSGGGRFVWRGKCLKLRLDEAAKRHKIRKK